MSEPSLPHERRWWRSLRRALGALCVALLAVAILSEWEELSAALVHLSFGSVVAAFACVLLGLIANGLSWREVLAGLGSRLPLAAAARVFLLAQLGKYLPGSIWPLVAQTELARDHGVPRARSAIAGVVALLIGMVVGTLVAAVCVLPVQGPDSRWWPWGAFVAAPLLVVLHPRILGWLVRTTLRLTRQPAPEKELQAEPLLRSAAWSLAMWFALGLQVWFLFRDLGGESDQALLLSVGSYAAAWVAGFLVVVAPAGAGAREATLVLLLTPSLGRPDALALAVTSRALTLIGDGVCALGAILVGGSGRSRSQLTADRADQGAQ